ncbi:MAG: hypothetical protein RL246_1138 [Bacteroidota bacterium]|jgi:hypothetical protein
MNTFLKFTLTACLISLGFTMFAQTPKINGSTAAEIHGYTGKSVKFEASGCPTTSIYVWKYSTKSVSTQDTWAGAFQTGSGTGENPVTAFTVPLGGPSDPNQPEIHSPLVYTVNCKDTTSNIVSPSSAKVTVFMVRPSYRPADIVPSQRVCTNVTNPASGSIVLSAYGCKQSITWTLPNGQTMVTNSNDLRVEFSDPKFTNGNYAAECNYPSVTNENTADVIVGLKSQKTLEFNIKKAFRLDRTVNITGTGKTNGTGTTQEICKGTLNTLTWDIPSTYLDKFGFQWLKDNSGQIGSAAVAPFPNTNTMQASIPGTYRLRITADAACGGVQDSNPITISIVDLPKPSIAGNSSYCLDGTTSLSVDEASLTQNVGYLGVTKPASYTWYVNGVEDATLGASSSITLNKNVKIQVGYMSNANCPSELSSEVAVVNYERPATPTITAKTKLGFCLGTPIAAVLESSKNTTGGTIYEWSTTASTASVNIDKAGLYTVRVKDDNGCFSLFSAPTEVKVLPLPAAPVIAANSATIFCTKSDAGAINAVSITATSANDVIWSTSFQGKVLADVKNSGTYSATAKDANGCISLVSNSVKVVNQPNPSLGSASIAKEGVYNLKALNFPASDGSGTAGDFEWKFGSSILNSKVAVAKVLSGGDYTARRKYNYTIDGTTLTCFTDAVRYSYGVDPEFKGVAIYPNPITGSKVNIQTLEDWSSAEVTIYDMVGRPVYSGRLGSTELANELNVNGLGNGIYIVQIKGSGEKSFISKVIVNK